MKLRYIPNLLTIFRISLLPIFIAFYYFPSEYNYIITTTIFALAAITDWLDGYLARKLGQATRIGAFLDPVADKLIVVAALVLLTESMQSWLMTIPTAIIICREITISALREWMAHCGKSKVVEVSYIGKVKTAMQMVAILLLLFQAPQIADKITMLGYVFLYISTFFTIWSMYNYIWLAFFQIKDLGKNS